MNIALVEAAPGSNASLTRMPATMPQAMSDLEPVANIGYGAYAQVLEVRNRRTGERHALKVVEKKPLAVRGMLQQLAREFGVQRGVQHPNIVGALELAEDSTHAYLLLELCEGGSVWKATHSFPGSCVPEKLTSCWLRDAACGVAHLHDLGLVHRDVKLENLLLDGSGRVRLSDFGWCAFEADQPQGMCGTPQLAPPEVCNGEPQTNKVDAWSIGACLVQLLTGAALNGPSDAFLPANPAHSMPAQDLAKALLQHDPRLRLSTRKALDMQFLRAAEGQLQLSGKPPTRWTATSPAPQHRTQSPLSQRQRQSVSPARRTPPPQQQLTRSSPPPQQRQVSPIRRAISPTRTQSPARAPLPAAARPQSPARSPVSPARRTQSSTRALLGGLMLPTPGAALSSTTPGNINGVSLTTAPIPMSTTGQQRNVEDADTVPAGAEIAKSLPGSQAFLEVSHEVDALVAKSEARKRETAEVSRTHLLVEEHAQQARMAARQAMQFAEQALLVIRACRQEHEARAVAA